LPDGLFSNQKIPIWVNFVVWKMFIYFMAIWNMFFLWTLGIFYEYLVHFVFIWYDFSGFGIMSQEISGNPGQNAFNPLDRGAVGPGISVTAAIFGHRNKNTIFTKKCYFYLFANKLLWSQICPKTFLNTMFRKS
jgi:hypothetical protein